VHLIGGIARPHKEKSKMMKLVFLALGVCLFYGVAAQGHGGKVAALANAGAAAQDSGTETVLATYRVQPGKEKEFLKVVQQSWPTLLRLGLVLPQPHVVLRGTDEAGKPIFVEILTWVDHDAADHVPAEVQKIWDQMQSLCESRAGRPGIDFPEFQIVSQTP
jgi:hypothetical protein